MKTKKMLRMVIVVVLLGIMVGVGQGVAVGSYPVVADTFTDKNHATTAYGAAQAMNLFASNVNGICSETTYLWFKFQVPVTSTPISNVTLAIPYVSGVGSGTMDVELMSSGVTDWDENGLTWNTQPVLDVEVLATAPSTGPGLDVAFVGGPGSALSNYLESHKGEVVTLVMRANCGGVVSTSATRAVYSKEYSGGSGRELTLGGPTAVSLKHLGADVPFGEGRLWVTVVLACMLASVVGWKVYRIKVH